MKIKFLSIQYLKQLIFSIINQLPWLIPAYEKYNKQKLFFLQTSITSDTFFKFFIFPEHLNKKTKAEVISFL